MEWKKNARKFPKAVKHFRQAAGESAVPFRPKPIQLVNGKPCVVRTHTVDLVVADEDGQKSIAATTTFRQGQYIFPVAYVHPKTKVIGETKDVRFSPDIGWEIYLDAVLRDPASGEPVLIDGVKIDMSGWYKESDLIDAEFGLDTIKPGKMAPKPDDLAAARTERARRLTNVGL